MLKKVGVLFCVLFPVLGLFVGCNAESSNGAKADYSVNESISVENVGLELESVADSSRKLIRTVDVTVQTKEYDTFLETVKEETLLAGGYVEALSENASTAREYRYATVTLRIPAMDADGLLDTVASLGTVTRQEERVQDVTLRYVDTEAHLKALRTEEESLLRLLETAVSVEDIISIRDRLTQIRYEIEAYESTLRTYDNQIAYCTVTLTVSEVERETPAEQSMWHEIGGNLADAVGNIGAFFRNFFVFFVSSLPYLVVFGGIVFVILLFSLILPLRRRRKKRGQKENAA